MISGRPTTTPFAQPATRRRVADRPPALPAALAPRRAAFTQALGLASLLLALPAAASAEASAGGTSLRQLAALVAQDAAAAQARAPVALHVRSEAAELSQAFSTLLCAELSRAGLSCVPLEAIPFKDAEPVARERGARSLLRVSLAIEHGLVHARGDLLGTWVNFWSGLTPARPASPAAAIQRSVDADALALALLSTALRPTPAIPAGALELTVSTFARLPSTPAAIAAVDLDGDRKTEVLALTRDELLALTPDGKPLARRDLRALPLSPTPSREPYGFLAVLHGPTRLRAFTAARARAESLLFERGAFRALPSSEELVLLDAGKTAVSARPQPGTNEVVVTATFAGEPAAPLEGGPYSTVSTFALPTAGAYVLAVETDGDALLTNGPGRDVHLSGLATGSALVDLDADGLPELVSTLDEYAPAQDEVRVFALPPSSPVEPLTPLARQPIGRGRVLQLAAADVDGDGAQEILAASWLPDGSAELLLLRRVVR